MNHYFNLGYNDAKNNTYNNPLSDLVKNTTHTRQEAYNFMSYHNGHNTGKWDKRDESIPAIKTDL